MPNKHNVSDDEHLNDAPSTSSARRHSTIEHRTQRGKDKKMVKNGGCGELKGLQDSLSKFFTPSEMRRSRANSFRLASDQQLEVEIDNLPPRKPITSNEPKSSKASSINSQISPKSPKSQHRRDLLEDALTKYFTPNPDKRRLHKDGEYWQLSKGGVCEVGKDKSSMASNQEARVSIEKDKKHEISDDSSIDGSNNFSDELVTDLIISEKKKSSEILEQSEALQPVNSSQPNGYIRLKGPRRLNLNSQKRVLKKRDNAAAIKTAQLIKRAYKGNRDSRKKLLQPVSSSLKLPNSSSLQNSISNFRSLKKSSSMISSPKMNIKEADITPEITEEARLLFEKARQAVHDDLEIANSTLKSDGNAILPPKIRIHCYEVDTWYSSPYPQEYACLPVLNICDACLMYLSVPSSHMRKCKQRFPPGNEIYRGSNFSIFEVDGNLARVYCRNLCLLAKLFIDHKTLYFDVEPFLFYVLTLNDESGCHFVGYFSKEKFSQQKYNLACIVTLPCYQGRGFGRFLIDFSYVLSRREGLFGSPERPLSDLGKIAYQSYWLSVIFEYFYEQINSKNGLPEQLSLKNISTSTGIAPIDIAETLAENLMLPTKDSKTLIVLDEATIYAHIEKMKSDKRRIHFDEKKLVWMPKIYSPSKDLHIESFSTPEPLNKEKKEDEEESEEEEIDSVLRVQSCEANKKSDKNAKNSTRRRLCSSQRAAEKKSNKRTTKISLKRRGGEDGRREKTNNEATKNGLLDEANSSNAEPESFKSRKSGRGKTKTTCKTPTEKFQKHEKTSSSDEDEILGPRKLPSYLNSLKLDVAPSGSATTTVAGSGKKAQNSSSSNKCVISSRNLFPRKFFSDSSNNSSSEQEITETLQKQQQQAKDKQHFLEHEQRHSAHSLLDASLSDVSPSPIKRRKLLKKKKMKRRIMHSANYIERSCSTSTESSSTTEGEEEEHVEISDHQHSKETAELLLIDENEKKTTTKKNDDGRENSPFQQINDESGSGKTSVEEVEEEEEEEEEHSLCSSISPHPIGDRLPPLKEHENLVNMGGEPDTVNMGGEPDEEDISGAQQSISNVIVSSHNAPTFTMNTSVNQTEADDEIDGPPIVEQRDDVLFFEEEEEGKSSAATTNSVCVLPLDKTKKSCTTTAAAAAQQKDKENTQSVVVPKQPELLRIPTIWVEGQQKSSRSPSDVATVEMPALDAAERHISPAECSSRFGEDETVEDGGPPMLSPQAENLSGACEPSASSSSSSSSPSLHDEQQILLHQFSSTTNDEDSFKTIEKNQKTCGLVVVGGDSLQNTSSSTGGDLTFETERNHSFEENRAAPPPPLLLPPPPTESCNKELPTITIPPPPDNHSRQDERREQQHLSPQIRVRSESNVEFSSSAEVNKLQRTSSFSSQQQVLSNFEKNNNNNIVVVCAQQQQQPSATSLFQQTTPQHQADSVFVSSSSNRSNLASVSASVPSTAVLPQPTEERRGTSQQQQQQQMLQQQFFPSFNQHYYHQYRLHQQQQQQQHFHQKMLESGSVDGGGIGANSAYFSQWPPSAYFMAPNAGANATDAVSAEIMMQMAAAASFPQNGQNFYTAGCWPCPAPQQQSSASAISNSSSATYSPILSSAAYNTPTASQMMFNQFAVANGVAAAAAYYPAPAVSLASAAAATHYNSNNNNYCYFPQTPAQQQQSLLPPVVVAAASASALPTSQVVVHAAAGAPVRQRAKQKR